MHEPRGIGPYQNAGELPAAPPTATANPQPADLLRHPLRFSSSVVVLCVFSAWASAAAYIAADHSSLSPTDLAYNDPFWFAYLDPFVWAIALPYATLVGLVVSPIAAFAFWHRDLLRCGLSVFGTTVVYIFGTAPFFPLFAIFGSPLVAIAGLLLCRFTDFRAFRPQFRPWLAP